MNRRRYLRLEQELDRVITRPPERLAQILLACRAAAEVEYRRAARAMFDFWDIDTTRFLAAIEGQEMDDELRREIEAKIQWHDRLGQEAAKDDEAHAASHFQVSEMLRSYLKNAGKPTSPRPPKSETAPAAKPRLPRVYL